MLTPEQAREQMLSPEQRCKMAKGLIAKKVIMILDSHVLLAVGSNDNRVDVTLRAKECTDSDNNIRRYLAIMWYADIKISSDFPGYNESYEWSTSVKFRVP